MQINTEQNTQPILEEIPADAVVQPIGEEQLRKASEILKKYKQGKNNLESKIVTNEKWFRMRHWDIIGNENTRNDPKPASGWLFNTIISKHADFMDSYPECNVLPREMGDIDEAQKLSSIIPVVLEQNGFRKVYSDESWYKLKHGTGVYGVFWDAGKLNGLGDIAITRVDLLKLFWEPGIEDIQDSQNLFLVDLEDISAIEQRYPQTKDKLSTADNSLVKRYWYDDSVDTSGKCAVIDWYYHKNINGKNTLQYVKFVDEILLYATENDEAYADRGLYDHGKYPFVFDALFPEPDTPVGFGLIDVCKNAQTTIDIYNNAFEKNVQYCASPRYLFRNDGGLREEDFANPNKLLVPIDGNLGQDSYAPIQVPQLINSNYIAIVQNKIDEMKETTGNRDVTTGGTQAGVTAASAIAAIQESAGKTSRDQIQGSYEACKGVFNLVIELIRQFYDMPRQFRILGENGQPEYTSYTNEGMQLQPQESLLGEDMGYRLPVFDLKVDAEKASAYSRLSQNELALQFYNNGFFNPQFSDQALACINMMEFQGKDAVVQTIQQNGGLQQQITQLQQQYLQLAEMFDQVTGGQYAVADNAAQSINQQLDSQGVAGGSGRMQTMPDASSSQSGTSGESATTKEARERAAETTKPR